MVSTDAIHRYTSRLKAVSYRTVVAAAMLIVLWFAGGSAADDVPAARPATGRMSPDRLSWSSPEAQGMDSGVLAGGIEMLLENRDGYRIHHVTVIRNGHLIVDASFFPFSERWVHDLASVTKSVTSTLVGIAIDHGFIDGVDARVVDFFPDLDIANLDAWKRSMTVEDLLTMRSGLDCNPVNELTLAQMMASDDWVQFTLDLPMAEPPGQSWVYCSPAVHLLSAIIERATGMDSLEFARRSLLGPMGLGDAMWLADPSGVRHGWGDLFLTPVDMTVLGQLVLNGGQWDGRQVVSRAWIEDATDEAAVVVPGLPLGDRYGYLWWVDDDRIIADGRGGQTILVFPDEYLVVGLAGGGGANQGAIMTEFVETWVLGAIESSDPLPADPEGEALLESMVDAAGASTDGQPVPPDPLPDLAHEISGRTYILDPNAFGIAWLRLRFPDGEEAYLDMSTDSSNTENPETTFVIGLDGVFRYAPGRFGLTAAATGSWVSDSQFDIEIDEISIINLWLFGVTFDGDAVTVDVEALAGGLPSMTLTGNRLP